MTKHKVKDAICLLDIGNQRDILDVNHIMSEGPDKGKSVLHILKEKHPSSSPPHPNALVVQPSDGVSDFHPVIFDLLDAASILSAALHTTGALVHQEMMLCVGIVFVQHMVKNPFIFAELSLTLLRKSVLYTWILILLMPIQYVG